MFSFVTVYTAMTLHIRSNSFIDNRKDIFIGDAAPAYYSGPLSYYQGTRLTVLGLIPNLMFNLNNWLADGLLVSSFLMPRPLARASNACSAPRSTVATLSTLQTSGLLPFPASCTLPL